MKRPVSNDGVIVHSLKDNTNNIKVNEHLASLLQNRFCQYYIALIKRPSQEDLISKNIIKNDKKTIVDKEKLKKALMRRPSVTELAEKKIIGSMKYYFELN